MKCNSRARKPPHVDQQVTVLPRTDMYAVSHCELLGSQAHPFFVCNQSLHVFQLSQEVLLVSVRPGSHCCSHSEGDVYRAGGGAHRDAMTIYVVY